MGSGRSAIEEIANGANEVVGMGQGQGVCGPVNDAELGARYAFGQPTSDIDREEGVLGSVQHDGGDPEAIESGADIESVDR